MQVMIPFLIGIMILDLNSKFSKSRGYALINHLGYCINSLIYILLHNNKYIEEYGI